MFGMYMYEKDAFSKTIKYAPKSTVVLNCGGKTSCNSCTRVLVIGNQVLWEKSNY